jgi:hypothetical protein
MTNLGSAITCKGTEEVHTLVIGEQLIGLKAFHVVHRVVQPTPQPTGGSTAPSF